MPRRFPGLAEPRPNVAATPARDAGTIPRDRVVVLAALAGLTGLSWLTIVQMGRTAAASESTGRIVLSCCGADFSTTFLMWTVMMVGMMVPSVAPMVLTFATITRNRGERGGPYVPTAVFLGGYLLAWTSFSVLAALAQWALFRSSLLDPHSQTVGPLLAGSLLLVAGAFQLSPAKRACLVHCRSPLAFFVGEWREGWLGALRMGLRHATFCIGCCWLLMALLFVAGVMNLVWVAAIAIYVLAEKMLPGGRIVVRIGAVLCLAGGLALLTRAAGLS